MATRNAVIQVEPDLAEAFNTAPKREQERVKSAMRSLLKLVPSTPKKAPHLSRQESELLLRINQDLPPRKRQRLEELTDKMEFESISDKEHAELLRLAEKMEALAADRLEAVIELARYRNISVDDLMKQLGMQPGKYAR